MLHGLERWGGAGYRLGSPEDDEVHQAAQRLIDHGQVERIEHTGTDTETQREVQCATYRLTDAFLADIGATRHPELN